MLVKCFVFTKPLNSILFYFEEKPIKYLKEQLPISDMNSDPPFKKKKNWTQILSSFVNLQFGDHFQSLNDLIVDF